MKKLNLSVVFAAVGMAIGIAVVVLLLLKPETEPKSMLVLLALGNAALGLALLDKTGKEKEQQ